MSSSLKYTADVIIPIVKTSTSKIECLRKLGLNSNSGNYDTLNKYINLYNLDISHFTADITGLTNNHNRIRIPIGEILVEHSTYSRSKLKDRLFKEGLKERICENCGQGEDWFGGKLTFVLDHKNGIPDDNKLKNLKIYCPNCNSLLDTHCGKNKNHKAQTYDTCECGETKRKDSKFCKSCSSKKRQKVKRPSSGQLKREIQKLGYAGVGRKYGVSDNAIRKWVKSYEFQNI